MVEKWEIGQCEGNRKGGPGTGHAVVNISGTRDLRGSSKNFRLKRLQLIPVHKYNPNILNDEASKWAVNREWHARGMGTCGLLASCASHLVGGGLCS